MALEPPTPQIPRPKSNASVISSGCSALVDGRRLAEQAEGGRAVDRGWLAAAAGALAEAGRLRLVGILVVPVFSVSSASTLPLATTRRSASTFFADAIGAVETNRSRASAHAARQPEWNESWHLSRPFLEGCHGWPGTGLLASGVVGRAFPGRVWAPQWPAPWAPATSLTRSQWRDRAGFAPDFP